MAHLVQKNKTWYIRSSYKVQVVDKKGVAQYKPNGKPVYKYKSKWEKVSTNKDIAKIKLGDYLRDKERGQVNLDQKHITWETIKDKYLAYSKASKSLSSLKLDQFTFRDIKVFHPNIKGLQDLTVDFAERFALWLKTELGNKDATVKRKVSTLKNIGAKLVDWDIVQNNPLARLKIQRVRNEKEIQFWRTPEEIKKVVDDSTGIWKTINIIGFCIGARISEIINMDWDFIDFNNNKYKIQSDGDFRTKSRKFRTGTMPPNMRAHLIELKKEQAKNKKIKTNKIIVYEDGSTPTMYTCSSYLRKFYANAGFKGYHAHCLRHTFAAHYLYKYRDIYGLSKLLGHSSVAITQKYYGHLLDNYFDKSMSEFTPY